MRRSGFWMAAVRYTNGREALTEYILPSFSRRLFDVEWGGINSQAD